MKNSKVMILITIGIILLSAIASGVGVFWQGSGEPTTFKTVRGEDVKMQSRGLYRYDSVSIAAQAIAQDWVTLVVGIPLLIVSLILALRGRKKGRLLFAGTLAYFLYTYTSYAFGSAYNEMFLVYVALFSLSLFGFVLVIMGIDVEKTAESFNEKTPRKSVAIFMLVLGVMLMLMWLGRIVPSLIAGITPEGLESNTTLFIQTLDLGIVIPVSILCGILLLRRNAWGYVLASIMLVKGVTLLLAIDAMIIGMAMAKVDMSMVEMVVFPLFTLFNLFITAKWLMGIREETVKA